MPQDVTLPTISIRLAWDPVGHPQAPSRRSMPARAARARIACCR
jgi:hypothetical protein